MKTFAEDAKWTTLSMSLVLISVSHGHTIYRRCANVTVNQE